jgi:hypothetical protein
MVARAEAEILKIVRVVIPAARLKRIGPIGPDAPSWSCWIVTPTDKERDRVNRDRELLARLQKAASDAGLTPSGFSVQSQETVDRDYEGSWFFAMR